MDQAGDFGAYRAEPTLPELLADPMTRALMRADRVDAEAFEGLLHEVAGRLRGGEATSVISVMSFDDRADAKFHPAAPWRSLIDLPFSPTTARFMHGAVRTKASDLACGRACSW